MTIAPGIYDLHRAGEAVRSQTLEDEASGLRVAVGPSGIDAAPEDAVTTIVLAGSVHAGSLGHFVEGEAMVTQGAPSLVVAGADWAMISCRNATVPADLALRPGTNPELPPCDPTPSDLLLSGSPEQHDLTVFKDKARNFGAGFWTTTAYHRRSIPFPKFEVMHMLSGWIELTLDEGPTHRFEAGDTFLIAKGTRCDWRTGGMSKIFCTLVPEG